MRNRRTRKISFVLLLLTLLPISTLGRQLVLVLSQDDLKEAATVDSTTLTDDVSDTGFDDFIDSEAKPDYVLDPGSWSPIFEPAISPSDQLEGAYYNAVSKIVKAYSRGDERAMEEAAREIETAAASGHPHAQSILGFLYGMGIGRERNKAKAFLYHHFAAEGGNMQSKMTLAYTYSRQEMHEKAVKLYAELAEVAINSFLISKDSPVIEPVRIHSGAEENKEALRKSRGEEDEDFQILEYQAQKGNAGAMYRIGIFYYFGLRGVRRDHTKALSWFLKAVEKGEARSMELLGEIYARGAGVERNFTKALEWLTLASKQQLYSAYNGLGYLYVKGYGVEKNYTKASALYKLVAERGPWSSLSRWALESYLRGDVGRAFLLYSRMAELGYEIAQSNAAWILDKYGEKSMCLGESGICSDEERHQRSHALWWQASEQGNEHAALLIGDAYYYGRGTERDYDRAAEAYMHAKSQSNAQAMFNLGYMHEHGQGLPFDLHLAKRYYDQALEVDRAAKLPVTLALASLWIRKNYADGILVHVIDSLPEVYPKVEAWVEDVLMEEGNATILTLFVCLLTVLYLRERQRRNVAAAGEVAFPHQLGDQGVPVGN
ncbi:ERAD-associated E3 ubiquitin-protein ligase component HRD3A isoform X3 [Lycium ferocissimum]|uniref:ERAD-associated E3 ubiquitin-protein ligase component HRD3A isoform X3 n=1 Tax=Lycium ferocissimum TaxID=112874 RepID=UPI0028169E25|nr:ERAD-associated E3 ubiquitin-protein ligase component HRD3A isoform X3 [Lycium ferocissimum]